MNISLYDGSFTAGIFDSEFTFPDVKVTENRTVDCFELEFYDENCGVTHLNGKSCQLKKGTVICARPGDIRFSELPIRTYYLKFKAEGALADMMQSVSPYFASQEIASLISLVKELMVTPSESYLERYSVFLKILSLAVSESDKSRRFEQLPMQKSREAIGLGIEYMETHFREKCNLRDIAAFAHFSPIYFHNIFKIATGKTPYEYLTSLRIEQAKRLLLTQSLPMSDIAEQSGFSSQSYFNSAFKNACGMTPSAYRRQILNMYLSENGRFS